MNTELRAKEARLHALLGEMDSIVVAYSGGVDSAYLAYAAMTARPGRVLCVTADSPSYPRRHRELAVRIAEEFEFPHEFVNTAEMDRPEYRANAGDRCYHCKTELYSVLAALKDDRQFAVIVDGNNADDRGDYRPGRQAAREFGVRSPLDEADLTKAECAIVAKMAHAGMARAVDPVHSSADGDVVFTLATGAAPRVEPLIAGVVAAALTSEAIRDSCRRAEAVAGIPSLADLER